MNKEFVAYPEALALEELGMTYTLDSPVYMFYDNDTKKLDKLGALPTPLYQQAFRWFREKHDLIAFSLPYSETDEPPFIFIISIRSLVNNYVLCYDTVEGEECKTKEEAELACLKKLIEIVKTKNK